MTFLAGWLWGFHNLPVHIDKSSSCYGWAMTLQTWQPSSRVPSPPQSAFQSAKSLFTCSPMLGGKKKLLGRNITWGASSQQREEAPFSLACVTDEIQQLFFFLFLPVNLSPPFIN